MQARGARAAGAGKSRRLASARPHRSLRRTMAMPSAWARKISRIDHVAAFTVE
jgi:hypothetical protein